MRPYWEMPRLQVTAEIRQSGAFADNHKWNGRDTEKKEV